MERRTTFMILVLVGSSLAAGCSGDEAESYSDGGTDGDTDADTDADTDTDSDSDSDSDTDTGENETPPELPDLCDVDEMDLPASGEGDGRWPDAEYNDSVLITWAYDEQEGTIADWDIQLAAYEQGVGVDDPDEPMDPSVLSEKPFMAARGAGFGIGWLDTRWDSACNVLDQDECEREIAFITLDGAGLPANPIPIRITQGAHLDLRPSIAATGTGFLIVWAEQDGGENHIMSVALDGTGDPGDQHVISGDETGALERRPMVAVLGTTAVAVWLAHDQNRILAQPMSQDGAAAGDIQVVDEGYLGGAPSITAGDDGFLVAWSTMRVEDFEIYTRMLDGAGAPVGEASRATWTTRDAESPVAAWNGSTFALLYASPEANGTGTCTHSSCKPQAFTALLDADGVVASKELRLSDNPNDCSEPDLVWDGSGWFAVWELRQDMRQQVYYGRMTCE